MPRLILSAFTIAFMSGCQFLGIADGDNDDHRQQWAGQHDGAYSFVVTRGCFCALGGTYSVQVVDLKVDKVIDTQTKQPVDATMFEYIETIEEIFDLIDRARDERADELHVEYAQEGYPKVVNIDWIKRAVDDEMYLGVSDVMIGVAKAD